VDQGGIRVKPITHLFLELGDPLGKKPAPIDDGLSWTDPLSTAQENPGTAMGMPFNAPVAGVPAGFSNLESAQGSDYAKCVVWDKPSADSGPSNGIWWGICFALLAFTGAYLTWQFSRTTADVNPATYDSQGGKNQCQIQKANHSQPF